MDFDTPRIRRLRHLLSTTPRSSAGNRYPDYLRRDVVAAIQEARTAGGSLTRLASALGLPKTTLSRWTPSAPSQHGLLRIDVSPVVATLADDVMSAPVVELAGGVRVHGLSLDDIVALHRRLA